MRSTKQVIVVRKFKNLRTGKYCSQVAHASMAFLTRGGYVGKFHNNDFRVYQKLILEKHTDEISHWLQNSFKKVVCYVETEQEIKDLFSIAQERKMLCNLVIDNGATEFNGEQTITAVAIGPSWENRFEGLTDHLPLF